MAPGAELTVRQRRLCDQELARDVFKTTDDIIFQVDTIYRRHKTLESDDQWLHQKAAVINQALTCMGTTSVCILVDVKPQKSMEKLPQLQIDLGAMVRKLPAHIIGLLTAFDPPPPGGAASPNELAALEVACPSWERHLARCAELLNVFTHCLQHGPEHRNGRLATQAWPAVYAEMLGISPGHDDVSPVITDLLEVVNVAFCKLLGPQRVAFTRSAIAPPDADDSTAFALVRMRMVVHLLSALERVAFLQEVVRRDSTTKALAGDLTEAVATSIVLRQPRALPALRHLMAYLALCLRLYRDRVVAWTPEGVEVGDGDGGAAVATTRAAALHIAMAHEILERILQGAAVARAVGEHRDLAGAAVRLAAAGLAIVAPEADGGGRRVVLAVAAGAPGAGVGTGAVLWEVPSSVYKGDIELLVARACLVFYATLLCIAGICRADGSGAPAEVAASVWYPDFLACIYYLCHISQGVLVRRWTLAHGHLPPRQAQEGQLALNALRALAMAFSLYGHALVPIPGNPAPPPPPAPQLGDKFTLLLSALRTLLLGDAKATESLWAAGSAAQALFHGEREPVTIAPTESLTPDLELLCIDSQDIRGFLEEQHAAAIAEASDTGNGTIRNKPRAKGKPSIEVLSAILQAREVNLRVWQLLSVIAAPLDLSSTGLRLCQTEMGETFRKATQKALSNHSLEQVFDIIPERVLANIRMLATAAEATEEATKAAQGLESSLPEAHAVVAARFEELFTDLRTECMENVRTAEALVTGGGG